MYDYSDLDSETQWNKTLDIVQHSLGGIFLLESLLKIVAQGFILHWNSYLRNLWNWIDFTVVVVWVLEVTNVAGVNLKFMRALRILRPLRGLKIWKAMRKIVQGMIESIPALMNAVLFMIFVFTLFAIFGTIQFGGAYYMRCRTTEEPLEDGSWPYDGI